MKNKTLITLLGGVVLSLSTLGPAYAQDDSENWPTKPLRWLVGFAAGGSADVLTRIAADGLSRELGQPVIVENKPGASGAIALKLAAQANAQDPALITVPGPIIFPRPEPKIGEELSPVILLAKGPMVVVGPAANKEETFQEVIESAHNDTKPWSYATSGVGTSQHLAGELISLMTGADMLQIPYKGGGQAVADVVSGQVPLAVLGPTPVLPHIKSGDLKAYAVTTAERLDSMPEIPTVQEAGYGDYDASQWFAAAISPKVEQKHIDRLNQLLANIIKTDEFQQAVHAAGMLTEIGSPEDLQQFINEDDAKWSKVVKEANLVVD